VHQPVSELSGGNQQKVALAKLLAVEPRVLFVDEPTRGVDIGAKAQIYAILRDLADQGVGIVAISSELPELIGISDRILVLHQGRIAGEVEGDDMNEETIMQLASGLAAHVPNSARTIWRCGHERHTNRPVSERFRQKHFGRAEQIVSVREFGLLAIIALIFVVMSFASPYFLTWAICGRSCSPSRSRASSSSA
jgi:ABC-type multidrug transport system ATPase subunit